MNISQPAVTRALQSLEDELGALLFHRTSHGLSCTEAGLALTARVKRALDHLAAAEQGLDVSGQSPSSGALTLQAADHEFHAVIGVAECGTISAAARTIGLSQAALNRSLRALECRLDRPLFHRTTEGMRPTPAGELLLRRAKLTFAEIRQGMEEIEILNGATRGSLRIGALPLTRVRLVPFAVEHLLRRFPEAGVAIVDGTYEALLSSLRYGDIDVIVGTIRNPPPVDDIISEELFTDSIVVVARADHPLTHGRPLRLGDGLDEGWVLPFKKVPLRTQFENSLQAAGLCLPRHIIETDSLVAVRTLLMNSDRLAIVSRHQVYHETMYGLLKILPIDIPNAVRPVGLTFRRDYVPTPLARAFFEDIRKIAAEFDTEKTACNCQEAKSLLRAAQYSQARSICSPDKI